mgnify:CR=1 FL=1
MMQYDPMQLDLLMKMVASNLGPKLKGLTKQQDNIMENQLDLLMEDHKGQAQTITPEELEGAYEIAMLHTPVNDTGMSSQNFPS